ncbi:MAG: hypothetical protein WC962_06305 [Phycisphaerae bacterium]
MSQAMDNFLNALQVKVEAMAVVPAGNTCTYPRNSEDWVSSVTNDLPYVQMFEGGMRADWWVTMAVDRIHKVNIWVYAHTRKACRDIEEGILDTINADLRVKTGAGVPTAIYCKLRNGSPPYIYDKDREIFLMAWEYDVRLRSDI